MPGGAPIDWNQPFRPHNTLKTMSNASVPSPNQPCSRPSAPIRKLMSAEMNNPVAMKRLMLQ